MNKRPDIHLVTRTEALDRCLSEQVRTLEAQIAGLSAQAVHDLIVSLKESITQADLVAGLTHVPVGQREFAREAACRLRERVATLESMVARA